MNIDTVGEAELAAVNRKLDGIVLPHVEFHGTPWADACEFVRMEVQRLDTNPEPVKRGVSIFIKLPGTRPGAAPAVVPPITLTLEHPTLREALQAIAAKLGLQMKVEWHAVAFVPLPGNAGAR